MTDKYADLRAALEAGPTPGPWLGRKDGRFTNMDGWSVDHEKHAVLASVPIKAGGEVIAIVVEGRDEFIIEMPELTANADFIAAASPEAIRALLAERDAMKATLEAALAWHESQDKAISKKPNANTGSNGWMRCEHQEQAEIIRAALAQEGS